MAAPTQAEMIAILGATPLFEGLSKRQLRPLAKACVVEHYAADTVVLRESEAGQSMVTIISGEAKVVRNGRRIATVGPGAAVGEMSLIDGLPRSASVVAESEVEALVLPRTAFQQVLQDVPLLARRLLVVQTARLRERDKRATALG